MVYTEEELQMMRDWFNLTRAEYQDTLEDCFEEGPVKFIFAPLFNDRNTKLVIGEPGTGKTHLIKLLGKEAPIDIYHLDKNRLINDKTLTYSQIAFANAPALIFEDDLHYLLQYMHL